MDAAELVRFLRSHGAVNATSPHGGQGEEPVVVDSSAVPAAVTEIVFGVKSRTSCLLRHASKFMPVAEVQWAIDEIVAALVARKGQTGRRSLQLGEFNPELGLTLQGRKAGWAARSLHITYVLSSKQLFRLSFPIQRSQESKLQARPYTSLSCAETSC